MIKDVFVLKKNSWHTKLMKRIWGWNYYDFSNMCPYFWLTVLNTLILPFLAIYDIIVITGITISKFVMPYLDALADAYEKRCNEKRDRWYDSYVAKLDSILFKDDITEKEFKLIDKVRNADYSDKNRHYYNIYEKLDYQKRDRLRHLHDIKEAELYRIREERNKKKYEQKEIKEKNNRQKIADVLPTVKLILKGLGIIVLMFVAFLLYKVIMIVVGWDWLKIVVTVGKYAAGTLIIGIVLAILWFTLKILVKIIVKLWCVFGKYCVPCEENRDKIGEGFVMVCKSFAYPFVKIGEGCVFLWELIIALKRNNCPGIDWED